MEQQEEVSELTQEQDSGTRFLGHEVFSGLSSIKAPAVGYSTALKQSPSSLGAQMLFSLSL